MRVQNTNTINNTIKLEKENMRVKVVVDLYAFCAKAEGNCGGYYEDYLCKCNCPHMDPKTRSKLVKLKGLVKAKTE